MKTILVFLALILVSCTKDEVPTQTQQTVVKNCNCETVTATIPMVIDYDKQGNVIDFYALITLKNDCSGVVRPHVKMYGKYNIGEVICKE